MADVRIIKKTFKDEETGREIPYERLGIIGSVGGETHTLELKLENGDMLAAKMLLASEEKLSISSRPSSQGEQVTVNRRSAEQADDFFKTNNRNDDKINLNEDD